MRTGKNKELGMHGANASAHECRNLKKGMVYIPLCNSAPERIDSEPGTEVQTARGGKRSTVLDWVSVEGVNVGGVMASCDS